MVKYRDWMSANLVVQSATKCSAMTSNHASCPGSEDTLGAQSPREGRANLKHDANLVPFTPPFTCANSLFSKAPRPRLLACRCVAQALLPHSVAFLMLSPGLCDKTARMLVA